MGADAELAPMELNVGNEPEVETAADASDSTEPDACLDILQEACKVFTLQRYAMFPTGAL